MSDDNQPTPPDKEPLFRAMKQALRGRHAKALDNPNLPQAMDYVANAVLDPAMRESKDWHAAHLKIDRGLEALKLGLKPLMRNSMINDAMKESGLADFLYEREDLTNKITAALSTQKISINPKIKKAIRYAREAALAPATKALPDGTKALESLGAAIVAGLAPDTLRPVMVNAIADAVYEITLKPLFIISSRPAFVLNPPQLSDEEARKPVRKPLLRGIGERHQESIIRRMQIATGLQENMFDSILQTALQKAAASGICPAVEMKDEKLLAAIALAKQTLKNSSSIDNANTAKKAAKEARMGSFKTRAMFDNARIEAWVESMAELLAQTVDPTIAHIVAEIVVTKSGMIHDFNNKLTTPLGLLSIISWPLIESGQIASRDDFARFLAQEWHVRETEFKTEHLNPDTGLSDDDRGKLINKNSAELIVIFGCIGEELGILLQTIGYKEALDKGLSITPPAKPAAKSWAARSKSSPPPAAGIG